MKTIYYTAATLDGYIADENHSLDWLFQFGTEDPTYEEFIKDIGAIAMGSSTYEWVLKNDTFADPANPKPWVYSQPTWIFTSRTLPTVPNADIRFVKGDVRPVYDEIRQAANGKNLWLVGGGELVGQFHDHGLLDEMIITMTPVMLTKGAPLFTRRISKPPMEIVSVRHIPKDFVQLHLKVAKK